MIHQAIRSPINNFCCSCVVTDHSMVDDGSFTCRPKRIGASILLCGRRKSHFPFQCMIGPDWPLVMLVYFLIITINVIILAVSSPLGWPPILIGAFGAITLLTTYSMTVCSDPGIVYKNDYVAASSDALAQDLESSPNSSMLQQGGRALETVHGADLMECGHCQFLRPKCARHCTFCQVCVDELDHHCPW
ncbi:hypothetical protein EON64_12660 [archaeon]|nr:MAG: hypothetical protein EON64_12660 [archaeon]